VANPFRAVANAALQVTILVAHATSSTWRLSAIIERSDNSALSLGEVALLIPERRFGGAQRFRLGGEFLFVARNCSSSPSRAPSSEKIVAFFRPSSIFMR